MCRIMFHWFDFIVWDTADRFVHKPYGYFKKIVATGWRVGTFVLNALFCKHDNGLFLNRFLIGL